jgi:hypothetical protein
MDRRSFLLISLASALAAPLVAETQSAAKIYRIGLLSPTSHGLGIEGSMRVCEPSAMSKFAMSSSSTDRQREDLTDCLR